MNPKTQTLVSALRVLSVEIQSEDGVANAVVAEAADRLTLMANLVARHIEETKKDTQEMKTACETMNGATETIQRLKDRIKQLEGELMEVKNKHAVLIADVVLNEDKAEQIKRLEEAGDALYANCDPSRWDSAATAARKLSDQNAWLKAKEAKP